MLFFNNGGLHLVTGETLTLTQVLRKMTSQQCTYVRDLLVVLVEEVHLRNECGGADAAQRRRRRGARALTRHLNTLHCNTKPPVCWAFFRSIGPATSITVLQQRRRLIPSHSEAVDTKQQLIFHQKPDRKHCVHLVSMEIDATRTDAGCDGGATLGSGRDRQVGRKDGSQRCLLRTDTAPPAAAQLLVLAELVDQQVINGTVVVVALGQHALSREKRYTSQNKLSAHPRPRFDL